MITFIIILLIVVLLAVLLYRKFDNNDDVLVVPPKDDNHDLIDNPKDKVQSSETNKEKNDSFIEYHYKDDGTCVAVINKSDLLHYIIYLIRNKYRYRAQSWSLGSLRLSDVQIEIEQVEQVLIIKKGDPIYTLSLEPRMDHSDWDNLWEPFSWIKVVVRAPIDGYLEDGSFYDGSSQPLFTIIPNELIEERVLDFVQTPLDTHYRISFNGYEYYDDFYNDLRKNSSPEYPPVLFTWNKVTGDYVQKGEIIGHITCNRFSQNLKKDFDIKSRGSGIISIDIEKMEWGINSFNSPRNFYSLYQDMDTFLKQNFDKDDYSGPYCPYFEAIQKEDVFDKSISLYWERVAGRVVGVTRRNEIVLDPKFYNAFEMVDCDGKSLFISFQVKNNFVTIVFSTKSSEIRLSPGDEISLLLKDQDSHEFIINKRISDDVLYHNHHDLYDTSYYCPLTNTDIFDLTSFNCTNWRIRFNGNHKPAIIGSNQSDWTPERFAPDVFRIYANKFSNLVIDLESKYKIIYGSIDEVESTDKSVSPCYVYLMFDISNGYYKIGISNNPEYRERTLQSEKPTIEKICAKEYPNRAIALAIESALHKTYDAKRLRGEWFALDADDVKAITETLN